MLDYFVGTKVHVAHIRKCLAEAGARVFATSTRFFIFQLKSETEGEVVDHGSGEIWLEGDSQ